MIQTGGAIASLRKFEKWRGVELSPPPMMFKEATIQIGALRCSGKGCDRIAKQREGCRGYDVRRSAYIQTYIDYIDYVKNRNLQRFLAKLDARIHIDLGGQQAPPMMFKEVMVQIGAR